MLWEELACIPKTVSVLIKEAKVIVEGRRLKYNNHHPHSSIRFMKLLGFAAMCIAEA